MRILVSIFLALVLLLPTDSRAQHTPGISRIAYLSAEGLRSSQVESFRQGLRELGYVEGKNIVVEYRHIEGHLDQIPYMVRDLLQRNIDVFVSTNYPAIREARRMTATIPLVMVIPQDPIATGLIEGLARPGGNVTGLTRLTRELGGKRLELVTEVVPGLSNVGILWDADASGPRLGFKEYEKAAAALNIKILSFDVPGSSPNFSRALQTVRGNVDAIVVILNPVFNRHRKLISNLALKNKRPTMCERSDYVEVGCLMSYSADETASYMRAAWYVDKILKGAKPGDLPVEQPMKFEFVINLKTAKQIGLTIPANVLARADRVIK